MNRYKECIISNARLMAEWDWEENEKRGLDPNKLTLGSGKKAGWICSKGHHWDTAIDHRTTRGSNCPYCSNRKILPGYNDLKSQRPELMTEWNFETNTIDPSTVAVKSNKPANWICPKGHRYTKLIYIRTNGSACPICMQAMSTSFPEQCFFYYTKKVFPDAISRFKDLFDNQMELDIYIPSIKTGIEYDGFFWHDDKEAANEQKKFQICKKNHIRLFRIKEGKFNGYSPVADRIWYIPRKCSNKKLSYYILECLKSLNNENVILPEVDVEKDKAEILEYKTLKLEDSLLFINPEVAQEWHPTKNGKLTPDMFSPGSSENVWWLCPKCGKEWRTTIANRTKGHGCDVCVDPKRRETHRNTLLAKRKPIDKELCLLDWDYELNEYGPEHYTKGSGERVNWRCHKCGYKWKAAICDRTRDYKDGCPLCSGKVIVKGVNDLSTVRPELMQE